MANFSGNLYRTPQVSTLLPSAYLAPPGEDLNLSRQTNFAALRSRLLNPDRRAPRTAPTIRRPANSFITTKITVRPSNTGMHNRIKKYQIVFVKQSTDMIDKNPQTTLTLPQLNKILRDVYYKAMDKYFPKSTSSARESVFDSLHTSIFEDLEDNLTKDRRLMRDRQNTDGRSPTTLRDLKSCPTSFWSSDPELKKFVDDFKEDGLWALSASTIMEMWKFAGVVHNVHDFGEDFKAPVIAVQGQHEMDNYYGSKAEAGCSLWMVLKRHYNKKTHQYEHFEIDVVSEGNRSLKNIQSRYPDAIDLSYTGVTGYDEKGCRIYLGDIVEADGQKRADCYAEKLKGTKVSGNSEIEAWNASKADNVTRIIVDIRAKYCDRKMY